MVSILEVDNNVNRLTQLVKEVNKFLKFAGKNNSKFRLRPFDTNKAPNGNNKKQWRTRMIDNDSTDFRQYCQGYYPFTPPRGGIYRLQINAVMDKKIKLPSLIENVTHNWSHKDGRSLPDLKLQMIYDPIKIGYFMRATRYITHSYKLVEAMEWQANWLQRTTSQWMQMALLELMDAYRYQRPVTVSQMWPEEVQEAVRQQNNIGHRSFAEGCIHSD